MTGLNPFPLVGYAFLSITVIAFVVAVGATVLFMAAEPDGRFKPIRPRTLAVPVTAGVVAIICGLLTAVFFE